MKCFLLLGVDRVNELVLWTFRRENVASRIFMFLLHEPVALTMIYKIAHELILCCRWDEVRQIVYNSRT